jgi:hypothetical protein
MANGFYIIYSRNPHLAAVGFVWEPLTSIVDAFFLLGNHIWPALSHNDMAGSLTSACSMAAAAYQLHSAAREWGVRRIPRIVLTASFVLNPMILLYAGNGMSEGLYLFTLAAGTRYLMRWIRDGDLRSLAYAAIALAFSYLTRNEAIGGLAAGTLVVAIVSYRRCKSERPAKIRTAMADATIFAVPGIIAAAGWAIASYVITGSFFEQYSSIYGSSEQEALLSHESQGARVDYIFHAVLSLWPLIPIVLVAAVVIAIRRHDRRILAPLSVLGGALAFDMVALLNNNIQPFYRYFIVTIPIELLLVASLAAPAPSTADAPRRRFKSVSSRTFRQHWRDVAVTLMVLTLMIPAAVTTAAAMFNPKIGTEEYEQLSYAFRPHLSAVQEAYKERYPTILRIGSYLTNLKLPNGDIIVDNSTDCVPAVIVSSSQPKLFVIPNDRDFQRELSDPLTFHAHFILEPDPVHNPITAENLQYPTLWATGAGFAKVVHQFPARGTCPEFRLFKVFEHPTEVR